MHRLLVMTLTAAIAVAACSTSPTGRRQLQLFPEGQLAQMGATAFQEIQQKVPVEENPAINRYVECVADAITSQLEESREWEVRVFDDPSANAFALPGGKIGVHTGLLKVAETPDQLAAVIGHEIGHVLADHSNERVSTAFATNAGLQIASALAGGADSQQGQLLMAALGLGAQFGVLLPFSRTQESESDEIGLELMAKAGFDPRASIALWENMREAGDGQPPEFLSTHPSHGTRINDLREGMDEAMKYYQQARASGRTPNCRRPG
jgi:predicted Zn-dependent protease